MTRLLFVFCIAISIASSIASLHAEEVDQAVINEIREIRESMTLGKAMEGDDEAFNQALITIVTDDTEVSSEPESDVEAEVCPNGGSCCENVAGKVIAKALAAKFTSPAITSPPITPPDVIHPGQPVPQVQKNWHPAPLPGAISAAQMPAAPPQPDWANPQPSWGGWSNNFRPQPHSSSHHKIHALRETAFELDRIAHRLEMTNLFEAADEIRDTACELREEARELIEGDHQDEEDHDHDHDEEHDHDD